MREFFRGLRHAFAHEPLQTTGHTLLFAGLVTGVGILWIGWRACQVLKQRPAKKAEARSVQEVPAGDELR
ncbi:MAG: hypothetical protein HY471_02405 [Candidatus Sungbacteria bacterium]|nr:hypothetical protein [Candidatus Sungbacteria bacterium]